MKQIIEAISGYKTHITAILLLVANLGVQFGWFTQEHVNIANSVLAPLGLAFLRMGVESAAKK